MNRYEVLLLTVPEVTGDEASTIEKEVERVVKSARGKLVSFERWGKYKLAFPVRNNDYGVYFLSRFEIENAPTEMLNNLKTLCAVKFNDVVMRNMVTKLDERGSLEYSRPESLEEAPARDASSSFFKDRDRDRDRDRDNRPSRSSRTHIIEDEDGDESTDSEREEEMNLQQTEA